MIESIPCYVPASDRFSCNVQRCVFKGTSSISFMNHMLDIHSNVNTFTCLHCTNSTDMPLSECIQHLELHGESLYMCQYCNYFNHDLLKITDHNILRHPGCAYKWKAIRNAIVSEVGGIVQILDPDERVSDDSEVEVLDNEPVEKECYFLVENIATKNNLRVLGRSVNVFHFDVETGENDSVMEVQLDTSRINAETFSLGDSCDGFVQTKTSDEIGELGIEKMKSSTLLNTESEGPAIEKVCDVLNLNNSCPSEVFDENEKESESTGVSGSEGTSGSKQVSNIGCNSCDMACANDRMKYLIEKFGNAGSPQGNWFFCPKCNKYKTKVEAEMVDHLYKEIKYHQFVCTYCKRLGHSQKYIENHHMRIHKKSGKFVCIARLLPDPEAEQWVEYVICTQLTLMEKDKSCDEIAETGSKENHLTEVGDSNREFQCKECPEKFSKAESLNAHLKSFHFKLDCWICGACKFSSKCRSDMLGHIEKNHPHLTEICFQHCMPATTVTLDTKFWNNYFQVKTTNCNSSSSVIASKYGQNSHETFKKEKRRKLTHKSHRTFPMGSSLENTFGIEASPKHDKDNNIDVTYVSNESSAPNENFNTGPSFIFTCVYCPMLSRSFITAKSHWEIVHKNIFSEQLGIEEEYPFKFEKMNVNDFLLKLHSLGKILSLYCGYCMLISSDLFLMLMHLSKRHKGCEIKIVLVRLPDYCCIKCEIVLPTALDIRNHLLEYHSGKSVVFEVQRDVIGGFKVSPVTKSLFKNNDLFSENPNASDLETSAEKCFVEESKFICFWCKENFDARITLIMHHIGCHSHLVPMHKVESTVILSEVIKNCFSEITIMPTEITFLINDEIEYLCPLCPKTAVLFIDMFHHLFQHALPYKCCMCGFSAESCSEVYQHSKFSHSNVIPPFIAQVPMIDDVISRLCNQVKGVKSYANTLKCPSSSIPCKSKNLYDEENKRSTRSESHLESDLNRSFSEFISNKCAIKYETKEPTDYSHITVWYKLAGNKGRVMKLSELSNLININPYVCIKDCTKDKE